MAMTAAQKNVASAAQQIAAQLVNMRDRMEYTSQMFVNEGMNNLTDADYQELTEFAHVTAVEMNAAKGAIDAVVTTLGTASTAATNMYRLLKVINTIYEWSDMTIDEAIKELEARKKLLEAEGQVVAQQAADAALVPYRAAIGEVDKALELLRKNE